MCGRYQLTSPARVIAEAFGVEPPADLAPRWNIAPGQPVLAIRGDAEGGRSTASFRWGLVPWWSSEPATAATLINARSETAATTPAFRDAFRARRCLVPATGFYEWQAPPAQVLPGPRQSDLFEATDPGGEAAGGEAAGGEAAAGEQRGRVVRLRGRRGGGAKGPRQPFLIGLEEGEPFAIAGLWERWRPRDRDGPALETCTILTTTPNELMAPLHDRMPVILPREACDRWLDPEARDVEALQPLLRPYPSTAMRARPVGLWVNDPRHDDARCVEPV